MTEFLTLTSMLSVYWLFITYYMLKNERERERLLNRRLGTSTLAQINWMYMTRRYSMTRMTGL